MDRQDSPETQERIRIGMPEAYGAAGGAYIGGLGGLAIVGGGVPPKEKASQFTHEQSAGILVGSTLVGAVIVASVVHGARRLLNRVRHGHSEIA